jgi:hypothetical protein
MAQYLLTIYQSGQELSDEEFRQLCVDVPAFDDKLADAGALVFHGGVLAPESATVVRRSGADFLITDGPYTETKEHLAGFWIINAADLDAALEWARLLTVAHRRDVEVRSIEGRDIDELLAAHDAGEL